MSKVRVLQQEARYRVPAIHKKVQTGTHRRYIRCREECSLCNGRPFRKTVHRAIRGM